MKRTGKTSASLLLLLLMLATGCEWFPESSFKLADESRLPRWITLPDGLARHDATVTLSYLSAVWGNPVVITLRDRRGKIIRKLRGETREKYPILLKHPPPGSPPGYPAYEIVTIHGVTEVVEHRKLEPIFYVNDDPAVARELAIR